MTMVQSELRNMTLYVVTVKWLDIIVLHVRIIVSYVESLMLNILSKLSTLVLESLIVM